MEGTPRVEVGVRELRNNLSRYLERVREGEEVIVTDRGKAVARMVPIKGESGESLVDRLVREGKITPPKRPKRPTSEHPPPVKAKGTVTDLLLEMRGR